LLPTHLVLGQEKITISDSDIRISDYGEGFTGKIIIPDTGEEKIYVSVEIEYQAEKLKAQNDKPISASNIVKSVTDKTHDHKDINVSFPGAESVRFLSYKQQGDMEGTPPTAFYIFEMFYGANRYTFEFEGYRGPYEGINAPFPGFYIKENRVLAALTNELDLALKKDGNSFKNTFFYKIVENFIHYKGMLGEKKVTKLETLDADIGGAIRRIYPSPIKNQKISLPAGLNDSVRFLFSYTPLHYQAYSRTLVSKKQTHFNITETVACDTVPYKSVSQQLDTTGKVEINWGRIKSIQVKYFYLQGSRIHIYHRIGRKEEKFLDTGVLNLPDCPSSGASMREVVHALYRDINLTFDSDFGRLRDWNGDQDYIFISPEFSSILLKAGDNYPELIQLGKKKPHIERIDKEKLSHEFLERLETIRRRPMPTWKEEDVSILYKAVDQIGDHRNAQDKIIFFADELLPRVMQSRNPIPARYAKWEYRKRFELRDATGITPHIKAALTFLKLYSITKEKKYLTAAVLQGKHLKIDHDFGGETAFRFSGAPDENKRHSARIISQVGLVFHLLHRVTDEDEFNIDLKNQILNHLRQNKDKISTSARLYFLWYLIETEDKA